MRRENKGRDPEAEKGKRRQRARLLVSGTIAVLLGNAIPAYGVIFWNWPAFNVVALFVLEGVVVLAGDYVKVLFRRRVGLVEANLQKDPRQMLFFETTFILFFGAFAVMVFGPGEEFGTGFVTLGKLLSGELRLPFLYLVAVRLVRLARDIYVAGPFGLKPKAQLALGGGAWMMLLFCAVMLAPLVARTGPSPRGGLFALVGLKTAGELLGVYASVLDTALTKRMLRRGRSA